MTYPKRMKSKDGGFTHAYSVGEEDQLRVHGWLPEDESPTKPKADGAEEGEGEIVTVTSKRGRKPKADGADNVQ